MILNVTPEMITAAGTLLSGALAGWNRRQGRQISELSTRLDSLSTWRETATAYIGQLLQLMTQRGITPPTPPPSLGISVPEPHDDAPGPPPT